MEIENLFEFIFCDSIGTMMDETMVSRHTSPLLLQAIFFTMQNVGILSRKQFFQIMELNTKIGNKTHLQLNKCTISSSWKKLKSMFFKNLDYQKLTI
jgi:hypothetical protein